jgi:hypothetical protein
MEIQELKELLLKDLSGEQKYLLNTEQSGEALELLTSLGKNSTSLVFLNPQYEKVSNVLNLDYLLYPQSDYQIMQIF